MEEGKLSPVLESIRNDLRIIGTFMRDLSMYVISEEISNYPVYVAYLEEVPLGRPFFSKQDHNLNWNYNASILEEFVKHGLVMKDKVPEFRETFGDPEERACIFVVLPEEGGFVFVPYEIEESDAENPFIPGSN